MYKYPICNFKGLYEPACNEEDGSHDICPCCGFQFGVDSYGYETRRKKWIENDYTWYSDDQSKPKHWDPKKQLEGLKEK